MILRMPERFLPPFLKALKSDFLNKKTYLKFLRISSKFIIPCHCYNKLTHAYCATAMVLRTQKIFCNECNGFYQLYVRHERIFNSAYIGGTLKLSALFATVSAAIYGIFRLDHFLKNRFYVEERVE